jgi:hypothetical protein
MALSPNYGFPEPDNSSLVKNGAQDIRALGDAVDTAIWNVGFGQAGKNKIINGDFRINQRNFTSVSTDTNYCFDRFRIGFTGGTYTATPQTFTPGAAPVAGYEGANFVRLAIAGQSATSDGARFIQTIEDVRVFAGQTVTVSFWAKAASGTPKIAMEFVQNFGSGGSTTVTGIVSATAAPSITTSWARYSYTIAVPSISGKTIGTSSALQFTMWLSAGSDFAARAGSIGIQNNTFDIWGVQVEYGSKATPFQLAGGGDTQSELAMCQRYYQRAVGTTGAFAGAAITGVATSVGAVEMIYAAPVQFRVAPTVIEVSGMGVQGAGGGLIGSASSITIDAAVTNSNAVGIVFSKSTSFISGSFFRMLKNNNVNDYIGFGAEL